MQDLCQRIVRELILRMPCMRGADGRSYPAGGCEGGGWDVTVTRETREGGPGGVGRWAGHAGGGYAGRVILAGDGSGGSGGGRASP